MRKDWKPKCGWLGLSILFMAAPAFSQSTNQSYPTPVTTNEINGTIKARDVGDPRLTSYFYTFDGTQGDVFVNIASKNFNGNFDIFIAEGLKPLSKIVIYADSSDIETGRVIYLRKPEKLILRVEGRTPNDDPATFRIKFAGSFVAAADTGEQEPELPKVKVSNKRRIRVNSVGTIVEVIPKAKPTPKTAETVAEETKKKTEPEKKTDEDVAEKKDESRDDSATEESKTEAAKVEVVVSENIPEAESSVPEAKKPVTTRTRPRKRTQPKKEPPATAEDQPETKPEEKPEVKAEEKPPPKNPVAKRTRTIRPVKTKEPDPLENIHLVIVFKDGRRIEKPMSEVLRFSVDRGILTVVSKDGTIGRYAIIDVLKTTIE